ncbi:glucoamylase family protein [Ekhidna sp.]
MKRILEKIIIVLLLFTCGQDDSDIQETQLMQLTALRVGTVNILSQETEAPINAPIVISFNEELAQSSVSKNVQLINATNSQLELEFSFIDQGKTVSAMPLEVLEQNAQYRIIIGADIKGLNGESFPGIEKSFTTINPPVFVHKVFIDDMEVNSNTRIKDISFNPSFKVAFSQPVSTLQVNDYISISDENGFVQLVSNQVLDSVINYTISETSLTPLKKYNFSISEELSENLSQPFSGYEFSFYTQLDSTFKFPEITDDELLTKIQEQTFKYFWDFGHPVSGLARERNTSGETVTSGGSGFGIMAIVVAIERGFITRQEGIDRLDKIITFLGEDADRFHGVWSHWLNGTSGQAIPFSANDDGGDLVETAFMVQGLLTVRQYLNDADGQEASMITKINALWESVEWDWYTQAGQDVLYWHWSPNFGWEKNHKITGWNEALIIYVLAASSPTHTIDVEVYTEGWSRSGDMKNSNSNSYYGHILDLRSDRGGPLFFSHYSFLGLDPRNLSDQFANYWTQNVNHTLINRDYCAQNPLNYVGYGTTSWGLTASDNNNGYSAHSPDNDRGVITPTAAISALPYAPEESMEAIRHFYYLMGDKLWGEYGFYDAFNITENWYASSYLAIDQGPIICMVENHRTGLLWDLFMSAPEVQAGLTKLGFTY